MFKKLAYSLIFLCCLPILAWAQPAPRDTVPGQQKVSIDHADIFEYSQRRDTIIQKLIGTVELSQDSVFMFCDSAIIKNSTQVFALGEEVLIQQGDSIAAFADTLYYDGILKQADLIGNVVLINGDRRLFTDKLHYDLVTKIATYDTPGTLTDGETQLSSKRGYYYVDERTIHFKDSVVVINPELELRADTLHFNTETQLVTFLGPTIMRSDSNQVYCEDGFYDVENNLAEFRQNAQYEKGEQQATADVIRYDGERGVYVLEGSAVFVEGDKREATADTITYDSQADTYDLRGNAFTRDSIRTIVADNIRYNAAKGVYSTKGRSRIADPPQILEADAVDYSDEDGLGLATGNVVWQDTSADLTIKCLEAIYNQNTGFLKASGGARGRPLLITLVDGDSLYMTADTLLSMRADSTSDKDSSRLLFAYHDVRLFKSDMQALCDSLSYSSVDSLFRLFRYPIIWADTSQFTADTMHLQLANQQLDRIFLYNRSFILNSPDEVFFNQIKGKNIVAHFEEGELRLMDVEGNAESVYYVLDDERRYVGVNKTVCSEMAILFASNSVESIKFFTQPKGQLDPMGAVSHEEIKLDGFDWQTEPRPRSMDDLFGPPLRELPAPGSEPPPTVEPPATRPGGPPEGVRPSGPPPPKGERPTREETDKKN